MAARRAALTGALVFVTGGLTAVPGTATAAGDALFASYVAHELGSWPESVAIGDVTGDGRADVVATTSYYADPANDYSLWVFAQQGDGSLAPPVQYLTDATYGSTMALGIADLDEDGDADVVVTTKDGVEVWDQTPEGLVHEWTSLPVGARDLEVADVSGDGLADLVVNTDTGVQVMWQIAGDLMRSPVGHQLSTARATEVEVGDVTGDGRADVVTAVGRTVEIRVQQTDHSFAAPVSYPSGGVAGWDTVNGIAIGDTDGDGLLDVHASGGGNRPNAWVTTRPQLADGTLGPVRSRPSYDIPETLEAADVTGDGIDDLLVLHGGWNRLGVYDMTPGTAELETLHAIPYASHYPVDGLAVGDVSGDGAPDVAVADYNNGMVLLRHAAPGSDVTPPQTTLTGGPTGTVRTRTATFTFTADEPATFQCSLDALPFSECKSPMTYSNLAAGPHTLRVRAVDLAGNVDQTPAERAFTVEAPDTSITSGPTGTVRDTNATFTFASQPAAASYECRLDGGSWAACATPATYQGLGTGREHTFEVRGVSADGLADPTPASRIWAVDAAADLAVTTSAPATVRKGATLTWTTSVTNAGPDSATALSLTQALPAGVAFVSATGCAAGTTVSCSLATLAPGGTWQVSVVGKVNATKGTLTSTATVAAASWDRVAANDTASATTKIGSR